NHACFTPTLGAHKTVQKWSKGAPTTSYDLRNVFGSLRGASKRTSAGEMPRSEETAKFPNFTPDTRQTATRRPTLRLHSEHVESSKSGQKL
ncbi:MAG: hypothetical protein VYC97_10805, partial [SAR324 cluster bacterium]|nr:hypothetical protein [SAR324 cluster bacterium]